MRLLIVSLILLAFIAGCATIMHGSSQSVGISSTPSGANVTIDNGERGKTPIVAKLSRKDHHVVKIELQGYETYEGTLTRQTSGWVWGNIVFGGLVGLAVDAISGGLYKLTPNQISTNLIRGQAQIESREDAIYVFVTLKPDPSWEKIGNLKVITPE